MCAAFSRLLLAPGDMVIHHDPWMLQRDATFQVVGGKCSIALHLRLCSVTNSSKSLLCYNTRSQGTGVCLLILTGGLISDVSVL
jgi:hypothetical protein